MQPYSTHCIHEVVSKMSRLQQSIRFAIYPNSFAKNLRTSLLLLNCCRDAKYLRRAAIQGGTERRAYLWISSDVGDIELIGCLVQPVELRARLDCVGRSGTLWTCDAAYQRVRIRNHILVNDNYHNRI